MKIEMGESLFYSWLRHVKECQIVQSNWTTSPCWALRHEDELQKVMEETDRFFEEKYGYKIYKQTASLSQLLQQAECDVLGLSVQDSGNKTYAVDVAFHKSGLNYGDRKTTVMKIIAKCFRTAMCIYGYLDTKEAEIIFASPKISKGILEDVSPCIKDMQEIMNGMSFNFNFRIIANEDFSELVLNPLLLVSRGVADTNELFLRSYQMLQMFAPKSSAKSKTTASRSISEDTYAELKIGQLANSVMRTILGRGKVSEDEVEKLQDKEYSKKVFDINSPLLIKQEDDYNKIRYYAEPVTIRGVKYMLYSQWHNNDRPYLMKWIEEHKAD